MGDPFPLEKASNRGKAGSGIFERVPVIKMLVQPDKPALVDVAHARRIRREVAGDRVGDELGLDAVIAQGVEEPVRLRHRHPRVPGGAQDQRGCADL